MPTAATGKPLSDPQQMLKKLLLLLTTEIATKRASACRVW